MTLRRVVAFLAGFALAALAYAQPAPTYVVDELYSNADGSVQFVVLRETQGLANQHGFMGRTLTATRSSGAKTYTFTRDLSSAATANTRVLIGSIGFQALGVVTPDYVVPDRFIPTEGGSLDFAGVDAVTFAPLPTDGVLAWYRDGTRANVATNFAGQTASLTAAPIGVVEYYHAGFDHYFVTPLAAEIDALDSGRLQGWARTGRAFSAWPSAAASGSLGSPVCRFYIPPSKGDSHFFSASPDECADTLARAQTDPNFQGYRFETPQAFDIGVPNATSGACPAGTIPVYRLWNGRGDSNHRYTTERSVRDEMVARGYVAEGYGADPVAMCAPIGPADVSKKVSDTSPFTTGCAPLNGTLYLNGEVEPYLAINPTNASNLVGVWQQDRWSNGGARGNATGVSFDGGRTWERRVVPFTRCAGGNAANGGDFERSSDPWVTFAPDGTAYQIALAITGATFAQGSRNGILVSRSADGGRSWSNPHALIVDGGDLFNDKEAITADPTDARFVYASWDRLRRTGGGLTLFARTTDGGATWEAAREIHDPGSNAQTVNNIPVVLPDGTVINFFTRLVAINGVTVATLQLMRSPDKGVTWSAPITISPMQSIGARDPENGTRVRDAAILGSIAAGRNGQLAVVWQDARFTSGVRDAIALSRSLDGGLTWTTPVRVNRDLSVQAFVPTVAIRDDGTIGVSYYDFRSNSPSNAELGTDYWLAESTDGITWRESRIDGPFDLAIAPFAEGLFIGDYMSLGTRGAQFVPFYGRTNTRNTDNRADIAITLMAPPAVAAKHAVEVADDPSMYRTEAVRAMRATPALAEQLNAAIRSAMQARVPGWVSPAEPAGPRAR